jgi:predicted TPR repeat methyltransferase
MVGVEIKLTLPQTLQRAMAFHRAGNLVEAERLYRQICAVDPHNVDSLHYLGVLAGQAGRNDIAIDLIGRAVALKPDYAEAHNNLGNAFATQGRTDEAVRHYARALALCPDYVDAHVRLGNILNEQGQLDEAVAHYRRALALSPSSPETHYRLGNVLRKQRREGEATACYQRALAIRPDHADSWLALGNVFEQAQRHDDALAAYSKAPDLAEAWLGRARALKRLNRPEEAVVAYRQALAMGGDPEVIRFFLASLGAELPPAAAPKRLISSVYDQHSEDYDQHMVGTLKYRIPEFLFDTIMRFIPSRNLDILDLGCGTGLLGARVHPLARTLTGVDISSKMLEIARQREIYDDLVCGELIEVLQTQTQEFDLTVAADVLVYFGDLSMVFREVRGRLRAGGLFGFSVEASEEQDFVLRVTLRYAHSATYLREVSQNHGFVLESIESKVLRYENGNDVVGHIVVLRRS